MTRSTVFAVILLTPLLSFAAEPANGWRGNGTGLWPEARPPLVWYRIPKGVIADLRTRAEPPGVDDRPGAALELANGIVREWLVIGTFPVKDSVKDFNEAQIAGETTLQPAPGDKVGSLAWKKLTADVDDPYAFGPANLPWTDLLPALGPFQQNQVAYVHAYLFTPRGGTVRAVLEHAHGLKAWLNGKEVYNCPDRGEGMGNYYAPSRVEFGIYDLHPSPRFDLELKPGWNRLLLKLSTYNKKGWTDHHFLMRLMDLPSVPYESKNILWMTELPHRSNATPIIVGDRLFVMAEPDELMCIDRITGKILWTAANNYYELLTAADRAGNPAFGARVEPLMNELKEERDFIKRTRLRTRIQRTLTEIDAARFAWKGDGHFQAHFGIVGFTTPTPVSDGRHVWVWCGNGVAACYDLDGNRQWITRVDTGELSYASSPALADGTLAVFLHRLVGLDARTGKVRWEVPEVKINNGAVLAARIAGVQVFVTQRSQIVRARDGKLLYSDPNLPSGDTGWSPGVILGDVAYVPKYGVNHVEALDCTGAAGDEWKPRRATLHMETSRLPDGRRVDRSTAGSPLIADDLVYEVDIYGTFYVGDMKARKFLLRHDTELRGLFHYNALPVAASATLLGKHIVIQDNQGKALVLEPGREFRQIARNHIATQLDRYWPIPAQETLGYSPPVPAGNRLYLRGERYLYCIGEN
jgi:hypothetical protein